MTMRTTLRSLSLRAAIALMTIASAALVLGAGHRWN
jgi:hypothetical protein